MTIVNARDDLLEESPRLARLQSSVLDNIIEEFASRHILHYHEYVRWRANALMSACALIVRNDREKRNAQFYNMRVVKLGQIHDLATDLTHYIKRLDLLPIENFHRHLLLRRLMDADWSRERLTKRT